MMVTMVMMDSDGDHVTVGDVDGGGDDAVADVFLSGAGPPMFLFAVS